MLTYDSVLKFAPSASGNVAPAAIIHGPATKLEGTGAIAIDSSGDIYVSIGTSFDQSVLEFAPNGIGDVGPIREIGHSRISEIARPRYGTCDITALALDSGDSLYFGCYEGEIGRIGASGGDPGLVLFGASTGGSRLSLKPRRRLQ